MRIFHVRGRACAERQPVSSGTEILRWIGLGVGTGLAAGFALERVDRWGEPARVRRAAAGPAQAARPAHTSAASARAVEAALEAEPRLAGTHDRRRAGQPRRGRAARLGAHPAARARAGRTRRSCAGIETRRQQHPGARRRRSPVHRSPTRSPTRAHDRTARPTVRSVRASKSELYRWWTRARALLARRRTLPGSGAPYVIMMPPPNVTAVLHMGHGLNNTVQDVLIRFERMRGRAGALASRHRPRRHRDPERGREAARQGRPDPVRPRPRGFVERVWELRAGDRRRHPGAAPGHRLLSATGRAPTSRWMKISPARCAKSSSGCTRRADLPRPLHHQLVSPLPHRAVQRRSGEGRGRRTDLASPLSARRRRRPHHRRHHPARDDAGRYRRRGASR